MSEETETSAIAYAALDEAAAGKIDTPAEETKAEADGTADVETKKEEKQETKETETEQQERSRLGRRVSNMEVKMDAFMNEARTFFQGSKPAVNTPENPEYVSTADDVRRVLQDMEKEQKNAQVRYETDYVTQVIRLGAEEGLTDAEIGRMEDLLKTSFNKTYSEHKDPKSDAERNFLRAMRVIDKERNGQPDKEINLKGDKPVGTSINTNSKVTDKTKTLIKLDEYAQKFVDYHKMDDDKVRKSLGADTQDRFTKWPKGT